MFGKVSIVKKTMAIGLLPVVVLSCLFFWSTARLSGNLSEMASKVTTDQSLKGMDDVGKGVYAMCMAQQELLEQTVTSYVNVAEGAATCTGPVSFAPEKTAWTAINQVSKQAAAVELPLMAFGGKPLGQNVDPNTPSLIVDDVTRMTGAACTIFQRMNDAGDMLRVATSVKTAEGKRAVGSFIPSKKADGAADPIIETVLAGKTYVGRAYVVNAWYITAYRPIFDAAHAVVGTLFVGVPQESVESLRKQILSTKVMKTGYVFVLDSTGKYIISKDGQQDGQDVSEMKDSKDQPIVKNMIAKAKALKPGEIAQEDYEWKGSGDATAKAKMARLIYFQKWDWIIGVSCTVEEFNPMKEDITAARNASLWQLTYITIIMLILVCVLTVVSSRRIAAPIAGLAERFRELAEGEGDLTKRIEVTTQDETGQMADRFNGFMEKLHAMIRVVGDNSRAMYSASGDLNTIAENMGVSIDAVSTGTTTVAAAAEEVSASSGLVTRNVESASSGLTSVATATEQMTATIGEIAGQSEKARAIAMNASAKSDEISVRVRDLGEAAQAIEKVTETITSISAQTNLLALNATIEAARAGAAGKGFAVVANEIKELAQQTAAATEDIKARIATIQSSASGTVSDIVSIGSIIKSVNDIVASIATAIEEQSVVTKDIASSIAMASSEVRNASEQVRESSTVSTDIAREIGQLSSATQIIRDGSHSVRDSIRGLTRQAEELQNLVSRFKV